MLKIWTPNIAARFAKTRIRRIEKMVFEIVEAYGDVSRNVECDCDNILRCLDQLKTTVEEERQLETGI